MKKTKTLYALLIGINEYSNPRNNLSGCVNDVQYLDEFLQAYFHNDEFIYKPKILTNKEATRNNIIEGFSHFDLAEDGDICLFHYSGHGSQCPSPQEFSHLDADGKHETLVCHDSRSEGGRDLLDKELSFLIWKATNNKGVHFLAIMDCCHSGSNTRSEFIKPRRFSASGDAVLKIEDYLGYTEYTQSKEGKYTPPRGPHILLAATQDEQTAKEVYAGGKPRGIFTFCLLDALKEFQCKVTYAELINRIRLRIRNKVKEQSPQLEVTKTEDQNLFFLSKDASKDSSYFLSYDKFSRNWQINVGALHGMNSNYGKGKIFLEIESCDDDLFIDKIFPVCSSVTGADRLDTNKVYNARIKNSFISNVKIAFASTNDPIGEKYIKDVIQETDTISFELIENPRNSEFLIHAKHEHLFLTKLDEIVVDANNGLIVPLNSIHAVFKKIKNFNLESSQEFLLCLERIVKWKQILELKNLNSTINNSEIEIVLSRSRVNSEDGGNVTFEETDWRNPKSFDYQVNDNKWHRPMFQLKMKNKSNRSLWLSLVYCSDDFGINNILLPKHHLRPGEEVGASYTSRGTTQFDIPVQIEEHYLKKGITSIQEYLKLFVCTDEFETNMFNQKGIGFDKIVENSNRSLAFDDIDFPDWMTKEISLKIVRTIESKSGVEDV